jgi:hypothetical protein
MVLTLWLPDFIIERSQEDFDIMAGLRRKKSVSESVKWAMSAIA